jgi:transcriptional regulator with XRE-family HTH domain
MQLKKRLGKRIQELRYKHNMKQSELAEKVGIATKSQSCIETGKNYPSAELVERYAKVFNIDIEELLNIMSIKSIPDLKNDIQNMLVEANEQEIKIIHSIIRGIIRG